MMRSARFVLHLLIFSLVGTCIGYGVSHPVRVDDSSNCRECHADHATGDHVHPAVTLGCNSCHSITSRDAETYVVLKPSKGVICFECHESTKFVYPHLPYASGMCTRCHNPHVSGNPRLLRAKVNELCLSCHLRTPESVSSRYLPTIALVVNNSIGHPYERHPVSGSPDPLTGTEMSCMSCHLAHGGMQPHLLKMGAEIPEDALNQSTETKDMCRKCHLLMWGLEGASHKNRKQKGKK